jgi:hypothetical protein
VNKKVNTVLFMLGATLVNVIIMIALLAGLIILLTVISNSVQISEGVRTIFLVLIFAISIFGTYFFYNLIIKTLTSKIDMEKYFDPIFKPRKK